MYDDSDGWYDRQMGPIVNPSAATSNNPADADQFGAPGKCGDGRSLADNNGHAVEDHCGYGPRLFASVISPWARNNFVDRTVTDQSSALRFAEDEWQTGRLGNGSFHQLAERIDNMFDFDRDWRDDADKKLLLNASTEKPTGYRTLS